MSAALFPAGPGIRVDTHIEARSRVPPFYDSLLAKIIAHAPDRASCLDLLQAALGNCRIEGVKTNLDMHAALIAEPGFRRGGVDTSYFSRRTPAR